MKLWTSPYCGVQHYQGKLPASIRQVTVTAYETGAIVGAFGPVGFSHIWESGWLPSAEDARKAGELFVERITPCQ
jgi:hypothetical protein